MYTLFLVEWICDDSREMQSYICQLEIHMEPRYVWLPKGSGDSLDHQCCLTTCVLGWYLSLHDSTKTDNRFSTNNNSWFTSWVGISQSCRVRCPFRLKDPLNGQVLKGSCGTTHNEF